MIYIWYIEKNVFLWLLCGIQHSLIIVMPEAQQPTRVIILIIYFSYF